MKNIALVTLVVASACLSHAAGITNAVIEQPFDTLITADELLLTGGVAVKDTGSNCYIIAVGAAALKDKKDSTIRLNALKVAEIKAKKALVEFVSGVQHESETVFQKDTTISVTTIDKDGKTTRLTTAEQKKQFIERISETVAGRLASHRKVGTWASEDGATVYVAVAITVPRNKQ